MDDKTRALLGDREAAKRLTDAGVVLMQGDCLELLQDIPDGSVDMVLTDPPYSSGGMYRSDRANGSSKKYQSTDTKDIKPDFAGDNRDQRSFTLWETFWVSAAKKKMRPGGIAVIFTDWRQLAATIDAVQCGGLVYRGVMQAPSMFYRIWTAGVYLGIPQRKPRTHCGGSRKRRRRTSMKLVDADKARECFGGDGVTGAVMQRMFDSLPTIDAVPVVRCRDCKWFNHYTMECESDDVATDHEGGASFSINFGPDDFCSYGQRKEADHG